MLEQGAELRESEFRIAKEEVESLEHSILKVEALLVKVKREQRDTAASVEELDTAVGKSSLSPLAYSTSILHSKHGERIDTPSPFSAYSPLPVGNLVEALIQLTSEVDKLREKAGELAHEHECH